MPDSTKLCLLVLLASSAGCSTVNTVPAPVAPTAAVPAVALKTISFVEQAASGDFFLGVLSRVIHGQQLSVGRRYEYGQADGREQTGS